MASAVIHFVCDVSGFESRACAFHCVSFAFLSGLHEDWNGRAKGLIRAERSERSEIEGSFASRSQTVTWRDCN